ncbi:MAG: DUF5050 domain-containing protein [bacterium]
MICPRCHAPLPDDAAFCHRCGVKLKFCPSCKGANTDDARYCIHCGQTLDLSSRVKQSTYHTSTKGSYTPPPMAHDERPPYETYHPSAFVEEDEPSKKVNWVYVIIVMVAFALIVAGSFVVLTKTPSPNFTYGEDERQSKSESSRSSQIPTMGAATFTAEKTSEVEKYSNLTNNYGFTCDGSYVYMIDNRQQLVKLDPDFKNPVVLDASACMYINDGGDALYYTDTNHAICRIQKDGSHKQILVNSSSYYVVYLDGKIYYQNDADQESLYVYDMKQEKSTKLIKRHVYNLNIVEGVIYYTSGDGIYAYTIETKKEEQLIGQKVYSLVYYQDHLYYVTSDHVLARYGLKTKTSEDIVSTTTVANIAMSEQALYFYAVSNNISANGRIYRIDLQTKEVVTVYEGKIDDNYEIQVIHDQLIINENGGWMTINTTNQKKGKIFK